MQRLASPLVAEEKIFLSNFYVFLLVIRALASVVFHLGGFLAAPQALSYMPLGLL